MQEDEETGIELSLSVSPYNIAQDETMDILVWGRIIRPVGDPMTQRSEYSLNFTVEPGEVMDGVVLPKVTGNYRSKESAIEESTDL